MVKYKDQIVDCKWINDPKQEEVIQLKAKVEELQEEFAEDERFLKEQIKDKDLKIENLEYLQGMDKELIQTLQGKVNELQNRVDAALSHLGDVNFPPDYEDAWESFYKAEQALKGEADD